MTPNQPVVYNVTNMMGPTSGSSDKILGPFILKIIDLSIIFKRHLCLTPKQDGISLSLSNISMYDANCKWMMYEDANSQMFKL
jgi:hypothetical protein